MGRVAGKQGSTRQLASGAWQAYFPAGVDKLRRPVNPGVTYASEAKAQSALEDALAAVQAGEVVLLDRDEERLPAPVDPDDLTVTQMFERFLTENTDLSPGTRDHYRSVDRSVISHPVFGVGTRRAREVTTTELREWKLGLRAHGVKPSMENAAWKALSSAFSWEVDWHGLTQTPATLPKARRTKASVAKKTDDLDGPVPTWEEVWKIANAIPNLSDRLMMLVMAWSGPRLAEAAAITPSRLDHKHREIALTEVWVRESGSPWKADPLKGGRSRIVPIPQGLWTPLADFATTLWSAPKDGRQPVLFTPTVTRSRGGIGVYDRFLWRDCVWNPMRDATGYTLETRALRRYAASALVDAGATILEAGELLGHEKSDTTEQFYARARKRTDAHEARDRVRLTPAKGYAERLDLLYDAWVDTFGDPLATATLPVNAAHHRQVRDRRRHDREA